jgi:hypothetical protein
VREREREVEGREVGRGRGRDERGSDRESDLYRENRE